MFTSFIYFMLTTFSVSHSLEDEAVAKILRYDSYSDGVGEYRYRYDTNNNIHREERGEVKDRESTDSAVTIQGFYSYLGTDGRQYEVRYVADEEGYYPSITIFASNEKEPKPTEATELATTEESNVVPFVGTSVIGSLAGGGLGK